MKAKKQLWGSSFASRPDVLRAQKAENLAMRERLDVMPCVPPAFLRGGRRISVQRTTYLMDYWGFRARLGDHVQIEVLGPGEERRRVLTILLEGADGRLWLVECKR